jgi:two-component system sporulation sensor kinase A
MDVNAGSVNYDGELLIQAICHDLTERKRMQEQLLHNERLASMGSLAAGVAHEINNPISIIQGFMDEIVGDLNEGDKYNQELGIINQEVSRLSQLVKDLMTFAKPQSASPKKLQVKTLLERAQALLRTRMRKNNIKWQSDVSDDLPLVYVDDSQLLQVFINIVLNAVDAMPEGGTINITTKPIDNMLEIQIQDSGTGMSEEVLKQVQVFNPFFTTKEGKGSGLGLVISKRLIAENAGDIKIESEEGKGTTIILNIPLAK